MGNAVHRQADAGLTFDNPAEIMELGSGNNANDSVFETPCIGFSCIFNEVMVAQQAVRSLVPEHGKVRRSCLCVGPPSGGRAKPSWIFTSMNRLAGALAMTVPSAKGSGSKSKVNPRTVTRVNG